MIKGLELACQSARYADNKQAEDIIILDVRGLSTITDFFVIGTATSLPHLKAIRKEVNEELKTEHQVVPEWCDGQAESKWIVLDYVDVMVHLFHEETRDVYALDELWSDAPRVEWQEITATS